MRAQKQKTGAAFWLRPIGWGTLIGGIVCLLLLTGLAAVLLTQDMPQAGVAPMALGAAIGGSLVGGFTAGRIAGRRGWLIGGLTGIAMFLLVFGAGGFAMLAESGPAHTLLRALMMSAAAAVGGMLSVNVGRRQA